MQIETPHVYGVANQYYQSNGLISHTRIPDLLVHHQSDYYAISSDTVLYFSKDGNAVRVFCTNKCSYIIDLSISQLWLKINQRPFFRRVSKYLIVNTDHILSIVKRKRKLIFLRNGEEIELDESLFPQIMDSVRVL